MNCAGSGNTFSSWRIDLKSCGQITFKQFMIEVRPDVGPHHRSFADVISTIDVVLFCHVRKTQGNTRIPSQDLKHDGFDIGEIRTI